MPARYIPAIIRTGALSLTCLLSVVGRAAAQAPEATPAPDDKAACIAAFDAAQRARATLQLLETQNLLLQCARPSCGMSLMSECTQMYTEVERAIPSVVITAKDEGRNVDLTAVEVMIDGRPFAPSLDGRPIAVDPGEYQFTFKAPGHAPLERRIVIGTGDKYRQITIVFPAVEVPAPHSSGSAASTSSPESAPASPTGTSGADIPVMSYVLGGVSVVGLGTFGVLRIISSQDFDTLEEGCSPTCPKSDVSNLRQKYLFSNISLGVGAAAAAAAVLWYVFDADSGSSVEPDVAIRFEPARGGGVAAAVGRF